MSLLVQSSLPVRPSAVDPAAGWAGRQGKEYTDPKRNPADVQGVDVSYVARFGIKRTEVNEWALEGVPRDATVLEVGCAHGPQLNVLAAGGFTKLEGCDVCAEALALCQWPTKLADGRSLPYADVSFDMVMTSGTLMQIPPGGKAQFMAECYRVAKRWIYGVEGATEVAREWKFWDSQKQEDVIPPAWTDLFPETVMRPGWKIVRARWLRPLAEGGKMSLRAYLLERE